MSSISDTSPFACVFPGQGSQRKGMGSELFDRHLDLCAIADEILGYSIRELCLRDPDRELRHTAFTQPALFVVNAMTWLDRAEREPPPSMLAGHSLGEYNALFAAGCLDFVDGLRLVQKRGALMAEVTEGGMAAVLDIADSLDVAERRVREVLAAEGRPVDIANLNLPGQLVLSGPKADLEALIEPMERAGARKCVMLNVSGAFHSRYMAPCAEAFASFLSDFRFAPPHIPVIANTTALPYSDDVASHLVDQIRSSVRWSDTMEYFHRQAITRVEELGPGKVLTKLWATASASWPTVSKPAVSKPAVSKPAVSKPAVSKPAVSKPSASTPLEPELAAADPELAAVVDPDASGSELGSTSFRQDYGLGLAYAVGSTTPGIRTPKMVARATEAGLLSFLDAFEPSPEKAVEAVKGLLGPETPFGVSLREATEASVVDVALRHHIPWGEAVGYRRLSPALLRFRFQGARVDRSGHPIAVRRLLAHVTRRTDTDLFLNPPPQKLIADMVRSGDLSSAEGEAALQLPVASDLCAIVGTVAGPDLTTLLPSVLRLRDQRAAHRPHLPHLNSVRVGAGGALGTPESIACAFMLGADFVQPSSIHMAGPESGLSPSARELLAGLDLGDTTSAPAADGFALGARIQVVKKGSFFAARAQKLYELFRFHDSLASISPEQRSKLEDTVFYQSLDSVQESLPAVSHDGLGRPDSKQVMADVFRWYLDASKHWAIDGRLDRKVGFQIPCDESMAAFNLYAAGTALQASEARQVDTVAERLMSDAASFLAERTGTSRRPDHPGDEFD